VHVTEKVEGFLVLFFVFVLNELLWTK